MYSQLPEGTLAPGAVDAASGERGGTSADGLGADEIAAAIARRPSSIAALKAEIARAMQIAADLERERIDAGVGEQEATHVEKIVARAAAEAAELSKHADEDVILVNAWYKDQVKGIRAEADRRIDDRRMGLEQSLTHHGSLIEAEVESVHAAVQGYRASLGAFFGQLAEERDPSAIARLAGALPDPPDLDEIRAEARSGAMQALEQGSAETPEPTDEGPASGSGGTGHEEEPRRGLDPAAVRQHAEPSSGAAIQLALPIPSAPSAGGPAPTPVLSDADLSAPTPEAPSYHGNVAVRFVRALTNRASSTAASEER